MGSYSSVFDKDKNKFQVWDMNTNSKLSVSSTLTLKALKTQLAKTYLFKK